MKPLKIYIVEDEPLITATIETALLKQGFKVVGDSDEYEDAVNGIERFSPDLVLLDINLGAGKDGIDLAHQLKTKNIPYLYLTSQTDPDTVQRVKETSPLGYIVKPFTEAGLRSSIEVAWHQFKPEEEAFLLVKTEGRTHNINQSHILYLKAFDNYCYVITETDQYLVPHTLKSVTEKLQPDLFFKTHRSYVVNVQKIREIKKKEVMIGDESVPLSPKHKVALLSHLS